MYRYICFKCSTLLQKSFISIFILSIISIISQWLLFFHPGFSLTCINKLLVSLKWIIKILFMLFPSADIFSIKMTSIDKLYRWNSNSMNSVVIAPTLGSRRACFLHFSWRSFHLDIILFNVSSSISAPGASGFFFSKF